MYVVLVIPTNLYPLFINKSNMLFIPKSISILMIPIFLSLIIFNAEVRTSNSNPSVSILRISIKSISFSKQKSSNRTVFTERVSSILLNALD